MPETILPDHGSGHQSRPTAGRRSSPTCRHWKRTPELYALGRALLELRARRSFSQEELAAESGLHRNYVGAIERGEINPSFRILLKLGTGLRLPLSEILEVYERHRADLGDQPDERPLPGQMTGRRKTTAPPSVRAAGSRLKAQRTGPSPTGQPPAPRSSSAEPPRRALASPA